MATIETVGRPGYMYRDSDSTWVQVAGKAATNASYVWTGAHQWQNTTSFISTLTAAYRFNSFLNPSARASAITSPQVGLISFIQQDPSGNTVNKFQYYDGSTWTDVNTVAYSSTAPDYPSDGNVWIDSDDNTMYVYDGSSWVSISGGAGGSSIDSFFLMGA